MIANEHIEEFIKYIYKLRNKSEAPVELIQKWSQVPHEELSTRISQLFDSWGYNQNQRDAVLQDFKRYQRVVQPKVGIVEKNFKQNKSEVKSKSSLKSWLIGVVLISSLILLAFVGIQYWSFKNLHHVYTLTERVAIRNENMEQVGTMDLNPIPNQASYQRLLVADTKIYHKPIDSTRKLYDHRKVYFDSLSFFDYVKDNTLKYGYVNAKFVVDSKEEFETYRRLFGQLLPNDNKKLQLKHRKVIANCLRFNKSLKGLYLTSACDNATEKVRRNNLSLLVHEIIPENKFEIIAKLSDGFYYQFIGDVLSNSYMAPRRIGYVENPNRPDEFLTGDLLFRYLSKTNQFVITNCNGIQQAYKAILNTEGIILYFEKQIVQENPIEPVIEFGENAYDLLKEVGDVVDQIFN